MDSLVEPTHPQEAKDTLVGGGEMGALMRSLDWSQTTLGPVESWPQSLHTAVSICLTSRFPIIIFWGSDLIQIYNDAYRPLLGASKHPKSMGQAARDCWPEIWHVIGPMLKGVFSTGQATWSDNQSLFLDRNNYIEECYFTFSYGPIRDETGGIGGVFCAVIETTGQILGERRLRTLGDLAARTADANTSEEACWVAAETIANNGADIPFALLYLPDSDGKQLHLAGATGLSPDIFVSPPVVDLTPPAEAPDQWPLAHVWRTGQAEVIDTCSARGQPPESASLHSPYALVLPMVGSGQDAPYGLLVAGISPYHALDADYRGFFELVAGQIATAVVNALAYQHERERSQALAELDRAKTTFFSNVSEETLHWLPHPPTVAHNVADQWPPLDDSGPVQGRSPLKSTVPPAYILLADDNADMRDYVRRLLSQYWTVEAVADGAVALTTARERIPDLVLSDVMMPGLNGFQLLHELRADPRTRAVPFILLSARAGEEATIEGLEAGADDYLVKPFSARELLARIGSHLEISRMRQDIARREHEHASRLQKLTEVSLAINTMRTLEEVFWLITAKAREIIGAHQSLTCMAAHENWVQPINAASFSEKYATWREYEIRLDDTAIYSLVCSTNIPLRMTQPELQAHPLWPEFSKQTETSLPESPAASLPTTTLPPLIQGGLLAAPLIGRDQRNLGLLLLSDKYDGEFTEEDEAILVQLAQIASIAIENAQLYSQTQNAVHARDALLSTVTHDLKNPLAAIKGYTQLLQRGINSGDQERLLAGLARIEVTTVKMTSLINELLDLSHLQMGQPLELDIHPTDLVALVRQLVAEQQQTTQYHHIHIEASVTQLIGLFDSIRLGRMLANLLANAIKYDLEGKRISVEVRQEEEADRSYAVLVVRDQGVGIPAKDLPHIFEQFYRASNVTKHISGTGIGLASALQIVEQHGGTITATSKEGEGSTFTVRLPLLTE